MTTLDVLCFLVDLVTDESMHFVLAFFSGSLAALWMLTTCSALCYASHLLTRKMVSMGVVYFILFCCLLLGFSAALASHWLLDYAATWLTTPLGPPLWGPGSIG